VKATTILGTLAAVALAAAGPRTPLPWDDQVRAAIAASERGDLETGERILKETLERSPDPGLVAFDLGVIAFQRKDWIEAERNFTRSLDDAEAPAERRAKAHYNRAVCLLHRGGLAEFRAAIDGLERCLDLAVDADLRIDARANLELAKLLWAEACTKAKQPPKPNDPAPNAPPEPEKKSSNPGEDTPGNEGNDSGTNAGQPKAIDANPSTTGAKPKATEKTIGGKGNLPVRIDPSTSKPATEAEAREFLQQLGFRLAKDRRGSAELHAPPERADVKDW
jgi:tetratricopeptide (TPR) repeat protein